MIGVRFSIQCYLKNFLVSILFVEVLGVVLFLSLVIVLVENFDVLMFFRHIEPGLNENPFIVLISSCVKKTKFVYF